MRVPQSIAEWRGLGAGLISLVDVDGDSAVVLQCTHPAILLPILLQPGAFIPSPEMVLSVGLPEAGTLADALRASKPLACLFEDCCYGTMPAMGRLNLNYGTWILRGALASTLTLRVQVPKGPSIQ